MAQQDEVAAERGAGRPEGGLGAGASGEHEEALARLLPVLADRLPLLVDDVEAVLREPWPAYAAFVAEQRDTVVSATWLQLPVLLTAAVSGGAGGEGPGGSLEEGGEGAAVTAAVFEEVGASTWAAGLELPGLLAAYQAGAVQAWRHVAASAVQVGVSEQVLTDLAESVFVFVDHLGQSSTRGYVRAQERAVASRERLREELAELLVSGRSSPAVLRARAAAAGWELPERARLVVVREDAERAAVVPSAWLPLHLPGLRGAVVPELARTRREQLDAQLAGSGAVVGPPVPLADLPLALCSAEVAARLLATGVLTGDPLHVADHLDALVVHRDEHLLADLRAAVLAPLDGVPASTRDRLAETLEAWLRHGGARAAVAEELHVHPQTVRYRLDQLRSLFGEVLDEPRHRMRLLLALGWGAPAQARAHSTGTASDGGADRR